MSCSTILFSLFLISPCGEGGGNDINEAVAAAVANPQRPAEDLNKDTSRKPAEVLSLFEIKPGFNLSQLIGIK